MSLIRVVRKKGLAPKQPEPKQKQAPPPSLIGKTVKYRIGEGASAVDVAGVVRRAEGKMLVIAPAIPNHAGVLYVSKDHTTLRPSDDVDVIDMQFKNCDVKAFETSDPLEDIKMASEVREDGVLIDYRGVTFQGYGSTFQNVTPEDRDGDYILPSAFNNSLRRFKENPVMLTDHKRSVENLMGHYDKIGVTDRGLALHGVVTDSPHPDAVHVRFQIMEKSLKTLSIGGFFYYMEDYRGIEEIELHETSLVVIPANPDAHFQVLSLTEDVVSKAFRRHMLLNGGELRLKNAA